GGLGLAESVLLVDRLVESEGQVEDGPRKEPGEHDGQHRLDQEFAPVRGKPAGRAVCWIDRQTLVPSESVYASGSDPASFRAVFVIASDGLYSVLRRSGYR